MVDIPLESLSDKERKFAAHYCISGDSTASAAACGYQDKSAAIMGWRMLRTPHVLAAIHAEIARALVSDAVLERGVAVSLLKDETTPAKLRADLAIKLLDRAGHVTPRAKSREDGADRTLHEMSRDELLAQKARLEDEIASRARAINAPAGANESPSMLN